MKKLPKETARKVRESPDRRRAAPEPKAVRKRDRTILTKVKQKIPCCFRSPKYAEARCRISSNLKSMGDKGDNPMTAIQIALMGKATEMI